MAESVFIAGMYVKYGNALAEILDAVGQADEAADVRKETAAMEHAAPDRRLGRQMVPPRLRCLRPCGRRRGM